MRSVGLVFAVALAHGCSKAPAPRDAGAAGSPAASVASGRDARAAAQAGADASPGQSLQVNGDGVGPLREGTIVNAAVLGKLFPDCTVTATSYEAEGETYPAFLVAKDGNRLMQIEPDRNGRLSDIIVLSPAIPGPGGAKVGDVVDAQASRCLASAEAERVLCPSSTAPNIQFVVDSRGLSIRPEQELPLTQLRGRTIVAIRWYASSEGK